MAHTKVVIGDATLYHGDCAEVLKNGVAMADIVVTSPPYNQLSWREGSGIFKNHTWIKKAAAAYHDDMPEPAYQKWLLEVFDLCKKKTRGVVWINHKVRYRQRIGIHPLRMFPYPLFAEIIWDRRGSMVVGAKRFMPSHEGVYGFFKPHYWNGMYDHLMSVWRINPNQSATHPCTFPPGLIEPLIIASCPIRGTVLDIFMGEGETGIIATKHGRKFIGIEKDKKHFDKACRRIEAAHKMRK